MGKTIIKYNGWKEAGTATGTTELDISNLTFNELCIEVSINKATNREFFSVPSGPLVHDVPLYLRQGGYGTSTSGSSAYIVISVSLDAVHLVDAILFGTTYTSNSQIRVWYR